ncbi:PilZ domain-containing protein [Sphingomonas sp. S2-65]|uniref:PilZ domain-containing protein n=1 Tax=Sphingomonas sp. S2-65 TaxID=2903960 RepID=UPI001F2038CB|nr:PilZ domain-containing protein [Sphingomonas sp. S2-65]UYY60153.1 PilZ domain-containing protein [Sphingomonas sp. S2-65]
MLVARLEVLGEIDQRGAVRFYVAGETRLRGGDGKPVDVAMENLSRTGFLFLSELEYPIGTLVTIGLSGAGLREARIVWRDGERHGCEFLVPLPESQMDLAYRGQASVLAELQEALTRRWPTIEAAPDGDDPLPDNVTRFPPR